MSSRRSFLKSAATALLGLPPAVCRAAPEVIRSARSGRWSSGETWEAGKIPAPGSRVEIRSGHSILYDRNSDQAIHTIHIEGRLSFDRERDTRLDVGLLKIGGDATEDCAMHVAAVEPKPALEVGTPEQPIPAGHTALLRLVYFDGMDPESCPAIVCCGGRMDLHGAPMNRTWVKLGAPAKPGDTEVLLAEPVTGWRAGDRVVLTATKRQTDGGIPSVRDSTATEERTVRAVDGTRLTVDRPLEHDHVARDEFRAEVANLSRNVIVESADPGRAHGHTMYHAHSAGSISYAEFRHLGKEGVLARYSLHFHLAGDTMRGSSVIGASIWDSGNRWITVHGTNYLVVRDCVGYQSVGHGFFLEDGTEVYNVFDRNLAVQACVGKPLPRQVMPFDHNDGAGFWWANSLNTFTRNVACECDQYGFRFDAQKTADFDPTLPVMQPDGSRRPVDIRTLPFVRFEDNESHCQRRHGFNLGGIDRFMSGGVGGVGPDPRHPFIIRNMKIWDAFYAFHQVSPCVLVDNMTIEDAVYAFWRPNYDRHAYRGLRMNQIAVQNEVRHSGTRPVEADFPRPLDPVDDLPPMTVITHVMRNAAGPAVVRGTTSDNGVVKKVMVNGREARALRANFAEWEVVLKLPRSGASKLTAHAEDAAGNAEKRPHETTA